MDYIFVSTNLTFDAAVTTQMVAIPIIDDQIIENSEIINLTLVSTDSAVILNPSTSTITIEDEDSKLLYVDYNTQSISTYFSHFSGYNWI